MITQDTLESPLDNKLSWKDIPSHIEITENDPAVDLPKKGFKVLQTPYMPSFITATKKPY